MKFQPAKYCKSCGVIILNSSIKEKNRAFCKYCYKQEEKEDWLFKKDIVNAARRPLRRKPQEEKTCVCCNTKFSTAKKYQITCGKIECQRLLKNVRAKIERRKNKEVING